MSKKTIYYIMGVSGCGKSTVGKLLAQELNIEFFDGDDFHPESNVKKMASGKALDDQDREGWLKTLNLVAQQHRKVGAVIACSALKQSYRDLLQKDLHKETLFVFLKGSFDEILARVQDRKDHFMPTDLLQSQFDALEDPTDAFNISIQLSPEEIVSEILNFSNQKSI